MKIRKLICILLIVCHGILIFAACGAENAAPVDTTAAPAETAEVTEAAETIPPPDLPKADYEGYEFNIVTRVPSGTDPWGSGEMAVEELNGEVLNDSIAERNRRVEEDYNIRIVQTSSENAAETAKKTIMAGDNVYDLFVADLFNMKKIAEENLAVDLNTLSNLNFKNPWWDHSSVRDLSIGKKQYFVTGDFSFRSYNASWIYCFNKQMIEDFALDNPYELVRTNKWTIDKFSEMIAGISADVNGDGVMDQYDRYGLITERSNTLGMFFGAGNLVISKDSENYPIITINTERGAATLEKLLDFMNNTNVRVSETDKFISTQPDVWKGLADIFTDDRGLFYSIVMYTVKKLRNMDTDFGLLPMPKYDEQQQEYYTWTSPWMASGLIIPITADTERASIIAEYLCYVSMSTVRPAYYEANIEGKFARDTESEEMLDVILANRVYDLGMLYNWGGVGYLINDMTKDQKTDFVSRWEKISTKAQGELEKTIEAFKDME
ncbi:MAG TPA: extracellular solute-binding protein [Clostridiales bacterium]|nr:extracellular solute-binding protein [Clostridiales bacterium]